MNHQQRLRNKIHTLESIKALVTTWKADHRKIVFTNGCFDLIHPGHIDYLVKASDLGDVLIVALNTDASVQKLKGPHRPIQLENSRLQIMAALECVDAVFLFKEDTPLRVIEELLPDILVKGSDYTVATIVGADIVLANGGSVRTINYLEGFSTSAIESKIKKG